MKWKFVFNGHAKLYSDIFEAAKQAFLSGYQFLCFNGKVYFMLGVDSFEVTQIKISDLV